MLTIFTCYAVKINFEELRLFYFPGYINLDWIPLRMYWLCVCFYIMPFCCDDIFGTEGLIQSLTLKVSVRKCYLFDFSVMRSNVRNLQYFSLYCEKLIKKKLLRRQK